MPLYGIGDIVSISLAQTSAITVTAASVGASYTVTLAGQNFTYVAQPGDTTALIAAGIAATLLNGGVQPTFQVGAAGAVVTIQGPLAGTFAVSVNANMTVAVQQQAVQGVPPGNFRILQVRPYWTRNPAGLTVSAVKYLCRRQLEGPVNVPDLVSTTPEMDLLEQQIRTLVASASSIP